MIVEGYTDALMAHQAGFENVVASLGTALTPQQVALLTRYAKRIALAYDVDAAGEKAGTFGATALEELIRQLARDDSGVELDDVRVVRLPEGKDPDEVHARRARRWREEVRTARPIVDYLIDVHARAHDLRTPGGQARFVDAVLPIIRNLPNPVLRDAYLARCTTCRGVEERTLLEAMHRRRPRRDGATARDGRDRFSAAAVIRRRPTRCPVTEILRGVSRTEQELLRLVLLVPEIARRGARRPRPGPAADPGRPRAVPGHRARARPRRPRRPPALVAVRRSSTALDEESRALGPGARLAPGPQPARARATARSPTRSSGSSLELDDAEWQERSAFNRDATARGRARRRPRRVERLTLERRHLNEQRRSLDRRRDQTRLLARAAVAAG